MESLLSYLKLIEFYYLLTAGVIPHNRFVNYEDMINFDPAVMYHAVIQVELVSPKKYLFFAGGFENYYAKGPDGLFFTALQDAFVFQTGFRLYKFELGYQHYCTHPLAFSVSNTASLRAKYGSYDEIYLRISNRPH